MKALTVQQPWAWAIIHGDKNVENRSQTWKYRGPLAIHAGRQWSRRGGADTRVQDACLRQDDLQTPRPVIAGRLQPSDFPETGAIIGIVDLVDAHPDTGCCRPWGESDYTDATGRARRVVTHLLLENPRPLIEPVPCRGALGLWTLPSDVLTELHTSAAEWAAKDE